MHDDGSRFYQLCNDEKNLTSQVKIVFLFRCIVIIVGE